MSVTKTNRAILLLSAVVLCTTPSARAQVLLTNQHVDVGLGFEPPTGTPGPGNLGTWDLHLHDETNGIEYATTGTPGASNWAQLFVGTNTLTARNASSAFNFIGVGAGQQFYYLPQTQQPNRLYLGVGAEDNTPGAPNAPISYRLTDSRVNQPTGVDPDANLAPWLRLQLLSFSGPAGGQFSVWNGDASSISQSNQNVNQVWMATSDGVGTDDSLYIINGSHVHFNWAFTQPGTYNLVLQASGFLGGSPTNPDLLSASDPTTYTFVVEPIPEPTSMVLIGTTALGGIAWRRRRRESKQ